MKNKLFNWKEFKLENGLTLISIKRKTKISSIDIGIGVGSMYENEEEKGISHFIEHMLFKGTKKRDNSKINEDLEDRAGFYNAYTDYVSTVFSITTLTEELEASIEILSDMIINSRIPQEEIEKERGVILAEIRGNIDDVEVYSYNRINEIAFKHSPLKYDVIGCEKTVSNLTRKKLLSFYKRFYIPNNCIITITSPYEHYKLKNIVEKYFTNWSKKEKYNVNQIIENNKEIEKISYKRNIEQNTLIYLFTFHGLSRREEIALDILNYKLGQRANSILFRELREERGLVYDVYSEMDDSDMVKTLYIYTSIGEEDIWNVKKIIDDSIDKLKAGGIIIKERDIDLMKKVKKTSIVSMLEDSTGLNSYVLEKKMMGKEVDTIIKDLEEIDNIRVRDIYETAKKVLKKPTTHILMNKKDN